MATLRARVRSLATAGLAHESTALCHQVTTLDRATLVERIGTRSPEFMTEIEPALKVALDLD